jgi:hypothetical protein
VNAVSNTALEEVRQLKYKQADTYVRQQRVIHEAEQAEIERERAIREAEQAITDKENAFLQLMKDLLYGT